MSSAKFSVIILAAGQGTRMRSDLHKVLHPIASKPMLLHLLDTVETLNPERSVVVVGKGRDQIEAALAGRDVIIAVQEEQKGTGHAVQQAQAALDGFHGDVLILYADVPFVRAETMSKMLVRLHADDNPEAVVLGFVPQGPNQYGRIISDDERIVKMVEYKDATDAERWTPLCNSGLLAARSDDLFALLARVGNDNAQGEYYLPDIVNIAIKDGRNAAVIATNNPAEVAGINSRSELAKAESQWQELKREEALDGGATMKDPSSVYFSWDTIVGRDVTIEPNVFFGPGVTVADNVKIRAFSHIEGTAISEGAEVGPFARLRPGAVLGKNSKVGNFVEVKKAVLGDGAKANHLSYIGDAEVGAGANIGAGTITCNYDGYFKYGTKIGAGAFIGSNSALVAPVSIGAGAIVGAGSVITKDVEADALAVARGEQKGFKGWAAKFRATQKAKKGSK
nr:bifunctional UDP-N-acetylglucosamine diphosphorylase/glucosamine-1-phosphate N-acetyltransferase GlmU [uncultured Sphingomonas sp.]